MPVSKEQGIIRGKLEACKHEDLDLFLMGEKSNEQYLWHHNQAKSQPKQDHVDAIHPPQEDKVRSNRGAKMT